MECALAILSQITSYRMTTIELHPVMSTFDYLPRFDWNTLDKILAQPQFSSVTCVKFWMTIWNDYTWAIPKIIRENMPLCETRGILQIEVGSYRHFASKYQ